MKVLEDLRANSSSIEKERIIRASRDVPFFSTLLAYTYSPYKKFWLKFGSNQLGRLPEGEPSEEMFSLLDKLHTRTITGNSARQEVLDFASKHGELILRVCNKSLDCGISTAIINKAFIQDVVPTFNIQLAKDVPLDKVVFPIVAQLKYNGTRCITLIDNGEIHFKTRKGHSFCFPALEKALKELPDFGSLSLMLDGELCFGDSQNQDHTKISGLVNSSRLGTPIPGNLGIQYHVFDSMKYCDFVSSTCGEPYYQRWEKAASILLKADRSIIEPAKSTIFNCKKELMTHYEGLLQEGYEGLILKSLTHKYSFKRSADWGKMKATLSADLCCVACIPGEGKYENAIGALVCEGFVKNEDSNAKVFVSVKVGSGLTDFDRNLDESVYLYKTIEVKYNKVISSASTVSSISNNYSLFLPRFVCVREDK